MRVIESSIVHSAPDILLLLGCRHRTEPQPRSGTRQGYPSYSFTPAGGNDLEVTAQNCPNGRTTSVEIYRRMLVCSDARAEPDGHVVTLPVEQSPNWAGPPPRRDSSLIVISARPSSCLTRCMRAPPRRSSVAMRGSCAEWRRVRPNSRMPPWQERPGWHRRTRGAPVWPLIFRPRIRSFSACADANLRVAEVSESSTVAPAARKPVLSEAPAQFPGKAPPGALPHLE